MIAKYQVAFWINEADKTRMEVLKKKFYSQHNIFAAGLEHLESKPLDPIRKRRVAKSKGE